MLSKGAISWRPNKAFARPSQALMGRNKRRSDLARDAPRVRRSISKTLEI
jgi:hypothetical protein